MKSTTLKTLHIAFMLVYYTLITSIRSVLKYCFSVPDRAWVDKTIHHWADQLLNQAKVSYTVENPHNVAPRPGQATILMCNHSSVYDIPLGFKAFPKHSIRMLSKKELSKIPIFGKGMAAAEFPFVDRKNRYQAIQDLEYVKKLMQSGIVMWIAPEGTRSKDAQLRPFKKGAFIMAIQSKATIIPIGIRGASNIVPARSFSIHLNQKAEIHIGEPIEASTYALEEKEQLIEKTYLAIEQLIGHTG
jgi:1-acyl-sn-glycerol-3-phosphate acyltransferase